MMLCVGKSVPFAKGLEAMKGALVYDIKYLLLVVRKYVSRMKKSQTPGVVLKGERGCASVE